MGKGNMMAETTSHLTARLYAALRHTPGCSCGECAGGLNAVDEMERRILAAEARVTELEAALEAWQQCSPAHRYECNPFASEDAVCSCGLQKARDLTNAALAKEDTDE